MANSLNVNYTIIATTDVFVDGQHTSGILPVRNDTSYNDTSSIYYNYDYYDNVTRYDEAPVLPLENRLLVIIGYLQLILVIVGLIGNVLSIAVLTRPKHRNSSTATYLTALAFSDIIILLSGPLDGFLIHVYNFNYRQHGEFWCKFGNWITYASMTTSSWLLVAVTIERTISVTFPFHVKRLCTLNIAIIVVITIWFVIYILHSHFLYGKEFKTFLKFTYCGHLSKDYEFFSYYVFPWIDITMVFGIPCVCIILGNIVIIFKLKRNKMKRQNMTTSTTRHSETSLIVTLVVVNITFILTITPLLIFLMIKTYLDTFWYRDSTLLFVFHLLNLISNVNAALNFILYFLSGAQFRNDVKKMLKSLTMKLIGQRMEQIEV